MFYYCCCHCCCHCCLAANFSNVENVDDAVNVVEFQLNKQLFVLECYTFLVESFFLTDSGDKVNETSLKGFPFVLNFISFKIAVF